MNFYAKYVKRAFDLLAGTVLFVLASPFLLLTMLLLKVANKGAGVFFFQRRPGLNGEIFSIVKFKTMTDERDEQGKLLPDEQRLTKVGRLVRSTSLDELPQLFNVIKGDMSLIGPRPLLVEYLPLYSKEQMRRHEVRPGITGWAQVHGRNALDWQTKFALDVWYVDHISLKVDLQVLWLTVITVLKRSDISHEGNATMEAFHGNDL